MLTRVAGRALLAMVLDDSTAGTIYLAMPRMRARRVMAIWLVAMMWRIATHPRVKPAAISVPASSR